MNTVGLQGIRTKTNNVMEMRTVLGIEAARETIINEMGEVMKDMDIDPRHVSFFFFSFLCFFSFFLGLPTIFKEYCRN